jgi:hypothetical protein
MYSLYGIRPAPAGDDDPHILIEGEPVGAGLCAKQPTVSVITITLGREIVLTSITLKTLKANLKVVEQVVLRIDATASQSLTKPALNARHSHTRSCHPSKRNTPVSIADDCSGWV